MNFIITFFIVASITMLVYIFLSFKLQKRTNLFTEISFLCIYSLFLLILIFPEILRWFEKIFGIYSAINFIIYLSSFILFGLVFVLYKKSENQRTEITKLTREIAYLKHKKKK